MALRRIGQSYFAYYRDENGRQRTLTLHTRDLAEAKKTHAAFMKALCAAKAAAKLVARHGNLLPPEAIQQLGELSPVPEYHPRDPAKLRLDQMLDVAALHRKLSADHRRAFERFAAAVAPLRFAADITPAVAQDYLDRNYGDGNGKSYNNHLTMLNVIFRACLVRARLDASPFATVPRRMVRDVEHFRPLTADEFRAVFAAAAEPWKTASLIAWHTALRRETCFRLSWSHIDTADRSITIMPGKTARFGRAVYIPIHPELWAHLLTLPRPGDDTTPILSQWPRHTDYRGDAKRDYFAGLLHALGIRSTSEGKAGFHSLRASFVTRCDEAGISRRATKGIAGHTADDMTDLYSHDHATARQILSLPPVIRTA